MYLSIGTRQQAGRREKRNFNYLSEEILFRTTASTPALGNTQSVIQWAQGAKPPTVKRLGHDAGHSSSYHGEIKHVQLNRQFPICLHDIFEKAVIDRPLK
jgi:hypothetical protein